MWVGWCVCVCVCNFSTWKRIDRNHKPLRIKAGTITYIFSCELENLPRKIHQTLGSCPRFQPHSLWHVFLRSQGCPTLNQHVPEGSLSHFLSHLCTFPVGLQTCWLSFWGKKTQFILLPSMLKTGIASKPAVCVVFKSLDRTALLQYFAYKCRCDRKWKTSTQAHSIKYKIWAWLNRSQQSLCFC